MTYPEIESKFPKEYAARQANKLYYRYPGIGGESYLGKLPKAYSDCQVILTLIDFYRRYPSYTTHDRGT